MRQLIFVILIAWSMVSAQTVINAITAPDNASGLAWDGNYLWCGAYGVNGDTIYKLDPSNGNILKRLRWQLDADSYGLAFDQGDLWINDHLTGTDSVFRVDTITGSRLQAFPALREYMAGLANDGTDLWICAYYPDASNRAYKIQKSNGAPLDSINIQTLPQPWGATWDGQYLWACNDGNYGGSHSIYKIDVVLKQIVDSLASPGNRPWGLAWDGMYLWVVATGSSPTGHVAYQIDLQGGGTPDIEVIPASYNYGNVPFDTSFSFWLNIANVGDDTLTIDTIYTLNPLFYTTPLSFPIDIPEGAATNISVSFGPDTFSYYSSTLLIVSNDPVNETTYVPLSGHGVYPDPYLSPQSSSYNFGSVRVDCVKDWELSIANLGYPSLVIDSMTFDTELFFPGTMTFPVSLSCFDTTSFQIITRPSGLGPYSGYAFVHFNAPSSPYPIELSASGDSLELPGGTLLWSYDFPDNVVCVAGIADINIDGVNDVACEAYDAGAPIDKHLNTYWGNSSGHGVLQWNFSGIYTSGGWGDDCLTMGDDYNGDDVPDILLGTAWGDRSVYAVDAVTGVMLWYYDSHSYDGEGGWVYSVKPMPDINGDNIGEVLAGIGGNSLASGGPRSMYCFSGADGQIVWQLRIGDAVGSVNWIPDVNNDNIPDAICGAWGNGYDEHVYCVSGASSGMVYSPLWSYDCGGDIQSVIAIPDQNGDGKEDVIAGTWSDSVFCLSGADGSRIWATHVYGWVTKVAEIPDLIDTDIPGIGVAHVGTSFQVLNASNGAVHWSYPIGSNVWTVDAIEDMDGDGKYDVITGNQNPGIVYCFSGHDGSIIWSHSEGKLIYSIRAVDDISFDGYEDVLVGTQGLNNDGRFFALCGGIPGVGIAGHEDTKATGLSVYPRISRTHFNIILGKVPIDDISIYDAAGRLVMRYSDIGDDTEQVIWYAKDGNDRAVAQGIYFVRLSGEDFYQTEKLVVIK
ncbi:MAG: PQQ-binding-like beta-propeller repeat protein [candidate division WOR-3 bacterium]|nr:MAG: PQQ-binding-like beta-propeller repeat protein [candidate division WOR-3 bacterium]